jgi:hypothetical protein
MARVMQEDASDPSPGAFLFKIRGKLVFAETIENSVLPHSALAGHLDAPVDKIELAGRMSVRVGCHAKRCAGRIL